MRPPQDTQLGPPDRGQSSLELALSLPLVLVFMLLFVQVAVVVRDQLAVQAAARDGARAASAAAGTAAAAARAARAATALHPLTVTASPSQQTITVTVRYVQRTTVPIVGPLLPDVTLTATATMVLEPP
jgi:uncharacterized protein (UPF0333 family)